MLHLQLVQGCQIVKVPIMYKSKLQLVFFDMKMIFNMLFDIPGLDNLLDSFKMEVYNSNFQFQLLVLLSIEVSKKQSPPKIYTIINYSSFWNFFFRSSTMSFAIELTVTAWSITFLKEQKQKMLFQIFSTSWLCAPVQQVHTFISIYIESHGESN